METEKLIKQSPWEKFHSFIFPEVVFTSDKKLDGEGKKSLLDFTLLPRQLSSASRLNADKSLNEFTELVRISFAIY